MVSKNTSLPLSLNPSPPVCTEFFGYLGVNCRDSSVPPSPQRSSPPDYHVYYFMSILLPIKKDPLSEPQKLL